ncbi:MAG: hypothetical protein H6Q89_2371 [Myxococcaceae bacterium]|nr:hypothetical protein [Myxococcaceae bacterium]
MAELYLCTAVGPEGFEKEVVIKRIKAFLSSDPGFIEMFKAEARLASRLNHANVVQIFDFDKHDEAWFIAMEYVYGASLWELRHRCRELAMPFPPILVAEIGAQVARGLQYAHTLADKGKPLLLVHRDVTPHNVLLSFDGGVKLTDFGIAKAGTSFTAPGMLKGKFAYMSPEQARGEKVDARTDIFALGITLWEMLTGGRLFEGDSDVAVLRAVQESLIAPPARLNLDVPVELSEVVLKALARPLDQRFQTAQELERALAHFVLKNSASTDDSNVGLFLRQMFRDELEEADRAMRTEVTLSPSERSQTPIVDAYALGSTRFVNRHHEPPTQQTATPIPTGDTASGRPKTEQMPGIRPSRQLAPLMDEEDSNQRTDQLQQFNAAREQTAQMPGLRASRKLAPGLAEPAPAAAQPLPAEELPAEGEIPPADVATELPKKTLLPWIVAACLAVGLIAGLGIAVQQAKPTGKPLATVTPPPVPPVVARPPEQKPADLAAALVGPPAVEPEKVEEPVKEPAKEPVPEVAAVAPPAETAAPPPPAEPKPGVEAVKPKGFLLVEAIPYGTLYINNKLYQDIEGARRIPLAAGVYSLRFEHPKQVKNDSVTIKAGQSSLVKFHPLQK